jgi:hypothetical protein
MRPIAGLALAASTLAMAGVAVAQGTRIADQGSFTISQNGQRIGREDFTISAAPSGSGVEFTASATVQYGDRRLQPSLRTDSSGVAMSYEVTTRAANSPAERWEGSIVRGRVSARIQTPRGQSAKEFIVADGALVLDDEVFHQYFFIAREQGPVTVMRPRENTQLRVGVVREGSDRVAIGTRELEATRVVLTEPGGARREIWVDAEGRVLKVSLPASGIVALRDDPPR